jgi:flagella basal body P-ring formation protein FlgA
MTSLRTLIIAGIAGTMLGLPAAAPAQTQVASVQPAPISMPRFIGEQEIGRHIADLIAERNGGQRVEIAFHGYDNQVEVPAGSPAVLQVVAFSYDARSGRFIADVAAPGAKEATRVTGRATPIERIPVLKNRVSPGDTIARGDIEWVQVPAGRYGGGYIDKVNELVGQSPRRPLRTGEPIRTSDIGRPEVVSKNGLVTMVAQVPGLVITTTGRALDSGGIGDVIQVMNVQSKKKVQATITGPDEVEVITAPRVITASN